MAVLQHLSVAWQACDAVTSPASATPRPGAVAELMFHSGQTPWYKVLELTVATTSNMKMVCTFPVRMNGTQVKKLPEFMFGVGKGLHRSSLYQMYHEEDGQSVWYRIVYSDLVGYQTSDIRLLWTIITKP